MISLEEIQNLAELSRLKLSEGEISALQKDFDSILEYVSQISVVAKEEQGSTLTQGSPRSDLSLLESVNVMREDKPRVTYDPLAGKQEAMLTQAPKREGDYFVVRKIIDREM